MAREFEFPIASDTDSAAILEKARGEARGAGIALEGDDIQGRFKGTAEGTYRVEDGILKVEVTKKPGFVPWSMIQKALKKVFG